MRMIRTLVILLVALLFVVACGGSDDGSGGASSEEAALEEITFSIASAVIDPVVSYFSLGEGAGFFEEEGIKANFVTAPGGGAEAATALVGPRGDVHVASTIQDVMLNGLAEDTPIPAVCFMNTTHATIYQFAVTPDSEIESVEDLEGKRIGVNEFGSASEFYARAVLTDAGLDPESDVEIVAVDQGAVAGQALSGGDVDALALWDFTYADMQTQGIVELRMLEQPNFIEGINTGPFLCTRKDLLDEQPEVVIGIGRAIAKAMVFYDENPSAALDIHWSMFPETKPEDSTLEEAIELRVPQLEARAELLTPPEGEGWGYFDEEGLSNYIDYLGLDLEMTEVNEYFDSSLLEEINDFDEEAVRSSAASYEEQG